MSAEKGKRFLESRREPPPAELPPEASEVKPKARVNGVGVKDAHRDAPRRLTQSGPERVSA
jgi:hypothetical protein